MTKAKLTGLADLHMHLGSAATAHLLWEIAHQRGITLPEKNYWKFLDLVKIDHKIKYASYQDYFDTTHIVQSSPDAIEVSIHEAISLSYRKASVELLEIRFNPMKRNKEGLYDLDRIIFSALVGMKRAAMIYPVKAGIILSMDRGLDPKVNKIIIEKAIKFRNEGVVGIDMSGLNTDTYDFKALAGHIEKAKSNGLGITIHTGEAQPVEEMWEVLKYLNPDRIGHGIKAVEDPKMMEELVKRDICLEICPTSNITLSLVKNWREMGQIIDTLKTNGVKLTINSDGPVFFNTNVKKEFEMLLEKEIFTLADIDEAVANAKKHSFIK